MGEGSRPPTAESIAASLSAYRFRGFHEEEIQRGIEEILRLGGFEFEREARLSSRDRPDFLVGPVALEVKVAGSIADVGAQLRRYAEHDVVREILLVTTRASHLELLDLAAPKPVRVLFIGRGLR